MTVMFYCYFLLYSTMNKTLFKREKCRNELLTALFERVSKNCNLNILYDTKISITERIKHIIKKIF